MNAHTNYIVKCVLRVKYHNLKRERSLNALSLDEISSLWIPPLVFQNTADNEAVEGTKDSEVFFPKRFTKYSNTLLFKYWPGHSDEGRRLYPKQP